MVHMFCFHCKSEYPRGVTYCSQCGASLVYRFPMNRPLREAGGDTELMVVGVFHNAFDANLARTTLTAAGIESIVRSEDFAGGVLAQMSFIKGIEILVHPDDLQDAEEILKGDASGTV
jgi:Putative prokaryotic signal transducing protein